METMQDSVELKTIKKDMEIQAVEKELPTIVSRATAFLVDSNEQLEKAAQVSSWFRKRTKTVEERRKFFVNPLKIHVKNMNDFFDRWLGPLAEADRIICDKMLAWRKVENDRIAKENEKLLRQAEKKAERKGISVEQAQAEIIPKIKEQEQGTDSGTFRKKWSFTIESPGKIPIIYLSPDERKIKLAISEGIRDIAGCRIFEEEYFVRS